MSKLELTQEDIKVEEGRVVIASEELANAIQSGDVDFLTEDEANSHEGFNIICLKNGGGN